MDLKVIYAATRNLYLGSQKELEQNINAMVDRYNEKALWSIIKDNLVDIINHFEEEDLQFLQRVSGNLRTATQMEHDGTSRLLLRQIVSGWMFLKVRDKIVPTDRAVHNALAHALNLQDIADGKKSPPLPEAPPEPIVGPAASDRDLRTIALPEYLYKRLWVLVDSEVDRISDVLDQWFESRREIPSKEAHQAALAELSEILDMMPAPEGLNEEDEPVEAE